MAGHIFSFVIPANTFSEPEGESITLDFSVSPSASWLSFNAATGTLSGTPPNNAAAADYTVTVKADDPNSFVPTTTATMPLKVTENQSPSLDNVLPTNLEVIVGYLFSYTVPGNTLSDAESETITYSFSVSPSASWLSFDASTLTITGTPNSNTQIGDYTMSIVADDTQSFTPSTTATAPLKVIQNFHPQIANPIGAGQSVVARHPWTFTFPENTFTDSEGESMIYTYSVAPGASWLMFNAATRTFSGTPPDNSHAGAYTITLTATDSPLSQSTDHDFTLTVNANQPPTLVPITTNPSVVARYALDYSVPSGTFTEPEGEAMTYSFDMAPTASWLSFNTATL